MSLTRDSVTGKWFLAWTAMDQSINVMSSDDGLVFSDWVRLPGRSMFGPAVAGVHGTPVVAWTDADTSELKMVNGLGGQVVTLTDGSSGAPETSFSSPALAFFALGDTGIAVVDATRAADGDVFIAWTSELGIHAAHSRDLPVRPT